MAIKNITEVIHGDVILEGPNRTEVVTVELNRCMNHTHINGKACYHNATDVRVQDDNKKDANA